MENPESIYCESEWSSQNTEESITYELYNMQDEMAELDRISHKPDIEEDISTLIKEEPFNEEICIKDDPDDARSVKIEQDVTAMIVPKVERKTSPSKSYEDFGSDVNKGAKNMIDNITGFLNNDVSCVKTEESAVYSHHRDEGRPHALSRYNLSDKSEEFSSSTREDVTMECENLDVFLPSYVEKFVCNKCAKSFVTHKMLTDHQKVHSGEWSYDSDICQAPLTRNSVQQRWQKVHVGGQLVFSCDKCNRLFDSYLGSQIHKGHCGKVSKSCYCDELGIPCSFKNGNRNQQRHLQKAKLPFCCCICGKCFRLRKSLTNHVVTHSEDRPYNCAECGQGYKCRMGLIRHMAVHTNIKSYTCNRCSRDFLRKHDLKLHMLTHSEVRPYKCNECGRGFKSRQVLIDHCATHNVIKSFFCKSCSRGFRSRRAVYDHMCAHSKVKKYTCKECSRGYKCRKAFKRHINNHTVGK